LKKLIEQLSIHEGVKKFAYKCPAGKITVGIGRNIDSDGGLGLSDDEIIYLLRNDISRIDQELTNAFRFYKELDRVRKDAMINICFNLGLTRLRSFREALGRMEKKEYPEAAVEFLDSLWASQVGQRALDVTYMIQHGEYPDANG
jgi:lysozyme